MLLDWLHLAEGLLKQAWLRTDFLVLLAAEVVSCLLDNVEVWLEVEIVVCGVTMTSVEA